MMTAACLKPCWFHNQVVLLLGNGTLWKEGESSAVYRGGEVLRPALVVRFL